MFEKSNVTTLKPIIKAKKRTNPKVNIILTKFEQIFQLNSHIYYLVLMKLLTILYIDY